MAHNDTVRPVGVLGASPNGQALGASDYLRWDRTASKLLNGDLGSASVTGTSPPSVTWTGTPASSVQSVVVKITTGGNQSVAVFTVYVNGVQTVTTAVSLGLMGYVIAGTGLTITFTNGTYSTDNVYSYNVSQPTSPIGIGGSGLTLTGAGTQVYGGVRTQTGGRIIMGAAANDLPLLSPNRTRPIFLSAVGLTGTNIAPNALGFTTTNNSAASVISIPSRFLHHNGNSRLDNIVCTYLVNQTLQGLSTISYLRFQAYNSAGTLVGPTWLPGTASTPWVASHTYSVGNYLFPMFYAQGGELVTYGYYFRCTVGGLSGAGPAQPNFNTTPGSFTTDGAVTWLCVGDQGTFAGTAGAMMKATYNFDTQSFNNTTLDLTANRHLLVIGSPAGGIAGNPLPPGAVTIRGFQFNFTSINDMSFY